jgi:hypothetical protein
VSLHGLRRQRIVRLTDDPDLLLRQRDRARSALAKVLHLTYHEDMPERLGDAVRNALREAGTGRRDQ